MSNPFDFQAQRPGLPPPQDDYPVAAPYRQPRIDQAGPSAFVAGVWFFFALLSTLVMWVFAARLLFTPYAPNETPNRFLLILGAVIVGNALICSFVSFCLGVRLLFAKHWFGLVVALFSLPLIGVPAYIAFAVLVLAGAMAR